MRAKNVSYNYKKVRKIKVVEKPSSIPKFRYKSAGIIVLTLMLTNFFLPNMFTIFGLDIKLITLLANASLLSFSVCYCQFFIETKKGFTRTFVKVYVGLFIATSIISYFWLYIGLYI